MAEQEQRLAKRNIRTSSGMGNVNKVIHVWTRSSRMDILLKITTLVDIVVKEN